MLQPAVFAAELPELAASGLPIIQLDEQSAYPEIGFIDNDSYSGAQSMARALLDLGHRKIAFLQRWPDRLNHVQRFNGYRNALAEAGIEPRPEWTRVWSDERRAPDCLGSGAILLNELLDAAPDVTAVMAVNDELALGALFAARRRGVSVPQMLSVTGFDDGEYSAYANPPLSTVYHPGMEEGRLVMEAIHRFLESNGKIALPRRIVPTRLVWRETAGPAPRRS